MTLLEDYRALMEGEVSSPLAALANTAAWLMEVLPDLNWAGFYLMNEAGDTLHLGPFVGRTACTVIPVGKGVCGQVASTRVLIRVPDVHRYPGHITCDERSRSEMVLPFFAMHPETHERILYGVLDLDSPKLDRFTREDEALCQAVLRHLSEQVSPLEPGHLTWS